MSELERIKKLLRSRTGNQLPSREGLSTGLTLLNMALTGHAGHGLERGCYYLVVGDSKAGKTFLVISSLAEASINTSFQDYRLIYDGPERGARMDLGILFPSLVDRLERPEPSATVEEFYYRLDECLEKGPVVYAFDSMDAVNPEEDLDKFGERKQAFFKGKVVSGSYGTAKAKLNSSHLRLVVNKLPKHDSILLLVAQSRDNLGFGGEKTRGGGRAMRFYATAEMWFSVRGQVKKNALGKDRKIGSILRVKVEKNRHTGMETAVDLYHYPSCGFDDVGSCCHYLLEEGHWQRKVASVAAPEFGCTGAMEKLIQKIEDENREEELRQIVAGVWRRIEQSCEVRRKSRYG